jgi:hypothetical protein
MSDQRKYTSGRMLHYRDCPHFFEEIAPRLATDEELVRLPACSTCLGAESSWGGQSSTASKGFRSERFVCPACFTSQPVAVRSDDGTCQACAGA